MSVQNSGWSDCGEGHLFFQQVGSCLILLVFPGVFQSNCSIPSPTAVSSLTFGRKNATFSLTMS